MAKQSKMQSNSPLISPTPHQAIYSAVITAEALLGSQGAFFSEDMLDAWE